MDWIDKIKAERDSGYNRPLSQDAHAVVNSRYAGCTREHCFKCDSETGRAGASEDSLFTDEGEGPFCEECWSNKEQTESPDHA